MQNKEYLISYYLKDNFEMEQIRYNMYLPDDIYNSIPKLMFRFSKHYGSDIYDKLKICVEKFKGNLEWTIYPSFVGKKIINYLLAPKEEFKREKSNFESKKLTSEREYFSKDEYKILCNNAIDDIDGLYLHLKNNFHINNV